jgi:hypothetical protein
VTVSNGRAEVLRFLEVLARRCDAATMGLRSLLVDNNADLARRLAGGTGAGFVSKAQVSSTAIDEALEES